MAKLELQGFGGRAPKLPPELLSEGLAQVATNTRFDRGALTPVAGLVDDAVSIASGTKTIFPYDGGWLAWDDDRTVARSPIPLDSRNRIFYTDPDTYPKVYGGSPPAEYRLGLPRPATAPVAVPTDPPGVDPDKLLEAETVYYKVTLVDVWGTEGPPSLPSAGVDRVRDTDVGVTLPSTPGGNYNLGTGALWRLYRSNSGTEATAFQFVKDYAISAGGTQVTDDVTNANLQEVLPSDTWIAPADDDTALYPDGPLAGMVLTPNGVLAGFSGRTVMFSEPYLPHAWPIAYRITLDDTPVALVAVQEGLLALTTGYPVLITGSHPSSYSASKLSAEQPCVAAQSVVDMGDYALYASPDGLVRAGGGGGLQVVSEAHFDREAWQALVPASMRATRYENRYFCSYDTGTLQASFTYDFGAGRNAFVDHGQYFVARYRDHAADATYLVVSDSLHRWEADTANPLSMTWRSRKWLLPRAVAFGWLRVEAATYPVTVRLYINGTLRHTATVTKRLTPLPSLPRADTMEIEIAGTNQVTYLALATSRAELVGAV